MARQRTQNFLTIFIATIATGLMAYTYWVGLLFWPLSSNTSHDCPRGTPISTAAPIEQISVRVYNATDRRGLALDIAQNLKERGFRVPMWDNDTRSSEMTAVAEIRHGPDGLRHARTIAAQINGSAVLVPEPDRQGPVVDLILGQAFDGLNSPERASELMASPLVASEACVSG